MNKGNRLGPRIKMADSGYQHRVAVIDGTATHYILRGEGPLLLLLHGHTPGSCADVEWPETVEFFSRAGFTVCAFDQPGFGSTDNPEDFSVDAGVSHTKAFIESLEPSSYTMWGCSMGSYIAARIALDDSRVDRLILMPASLLPPPGSTPLSLEGQELVRQLREYKPSPEGARQLLTRVLFHQSMVTDDLTRRFYEMSVGKNAIAARERWRAPRPRPIYEDLKTLRASSLILWGADDLSAIVERGLLLAKEMPRAEFHIFQQCRHWPHIDQGPRTCRLVLDFLQSTQLEE